MQIHKAEILDGLGVWAGIDPTSRVIFTPLETGFLVWDLQTQTEYTFSKLAAAPTKSKRVLTDEIKWVLRASDDELRSRAEIVQQWSGLYQLIQTELEYRDARVGLGREPAPEPPASTD